MTRRDLRNAEREWRTQPRPTPRRFHVKRAPRRSAVERTIDALATFLGRTIRRLNRS